MVSPLKKWQDALAAVLKESRRTNEAELLTRDIALELEQRGNHAEALVTSATPLSDELRKQLTRFIKSKAKVSDVSIEENIDKSVIGGVKIETAVHSWDKTIARQLTNLKEAI